MNEDRKMEEDKLGHLKNAINELVWVHGHEDMTLGRAERLASNIFDLFHSVTQELGMANIK